MNHLFRRLARCCLSVTGAIAFISFVVPATSHALPSYARQTGSDCASCHIGGFGPQLTPYGMRFKIDGYIDSDGSDKAKVPVSGMLVGTLTHTKKAAADGDTVDGFKSNNNAVFQEASLFLAGRLAERVGSFTQVTYSGVDKKWALDQLDIRHTKSVNLNGQEATVGLSFNNNPTLTDPVNTLAQWRFPYVSSDFGYSPADMTVPLVERLGGSVMGLNAYTFLKNGIYAEYGLYKAPSTNTLNRLGNDDAGTVKGLANYMRLAYLQDQKRSNWSAGLVYFGANMHPLDGDGLRTSGPTDNYKDFGVDGSYQYLGNRDHIFTLTSSYIYERRNLGYTYGVANEGDQAKTSANQFRVAGSYHYMQHYGASVGWFNNKATADSSYANGTPGSLSNRADTSGYTVQVDWTPWGQESSWLAPHANVKLGMQYTGYRKYLGGTSYIDGSGNQRNAKDNNTLMFFIWTSI